MYDASSNMVMQGGEARGVDGYLNIDHPEIEDFIKAKLDGELTNFNISVGVTDAFMEALENDKEWPLVFGGKVHKSVQAKELWDMIISAAHACGDPGVLFLDRLQETNPVPGRFINATNPCVTGDTLVATSKGYFKVETRWLPVRARSTVYPINRHRRVLKPAQPDQTENCRRCEIRPLPATLLGNRLGAGWKTDPATGLSCTS